MHIRAPSSWVYFQDHDYPYKRFDKHTSTGYAESIYSWLKDRLFGVQCTDLDQPRPLLIGSSYRQSEGNQWRQHRVDTEKWDNDPRVHLLSAIPGLRFCTVVRKYSGGRSGADVVAAAFTPASETLHGNEVVYVAKLGDVAWAAREMAFFEKAPPHLARFLAGVHAHSNLEPIDGKVALLYDVAFDRIISTRTLGDMLSAPNLHLRVDNLVGQIGALARALVNLESDPVTSYMHEQLGTQVQPVDGTPASLLRWLLDFDQRGDRMNRLERLQHLLPRWLPGWEKDKRVISIDYALRLPNPRAFALRQKWKFTETFTVGNLQSVMHGDLHTDNIIYPPTQNESLKVVDFGRAQARGLPFFDLAFLELDIMRRVIPLGGVEDRRQWLELLKVAMSELSPRQQLPLDGNRAQQAWELIRPIRQAVADVHGLDPDSHAAGWWLATVAAGLHYALRIQPDYVFHDRLAGLLYAAFGLRQLLELIAPPDRWDDGGTPIVVRWASRSNQIAIQPPIPLDPHDRIHLAHLLLACCCTQTPSALRAVITDLPSGLASRLSGKMLDVRRIIDKLIAECQGYPGGLRALAEVVQRHESGCTVEASKATRAQASSPATALSIAAFIEDVLAQHEETQHIGLLARLADVLSLGDLDASVLRSHYVAVTPPDPLSLGNWAYPVGNDDAEVLSMALSKLAEAPRSPLHPPPLLLLVERLALVRPDLRDRLRAWTRSAATTWDISPQTIRQARRETRAAMVGSIGTGSAEQQSIAAYILLCCESESHTSAEPFLVRPWLIIDRGRGTARREEPLKEPRTAITFAEMPVHLRTWLERLEEVLQAYPTSTAPSVLFFLPRTLFYQDLDALQIQGQYVTLGERYRVIRRSAERLCDKLNKRIWQLKWSRLQSASESSELDSSFGLQWVDRIVAAQVHDLASRLVPEHVVGVGLEWSLDRTARRALNLEVLDVALKSGTPVLVWLRRSASNSLDGVGPLKELLVGPNLARLPDVLWAEHESSASPARLDVPASLSLRNTITFVWDDPGLVPPQSDRLVVPPKKGGL